METALQYKSMRYIRELADAGQPQEIGAVRLQDGGVMGNKLEVVAAVAESFRRQHNQGQHGLSETTRRMVQALPRVFTEEQSEAIHRSGVTLGEQTEVVRALKRKNSPGVDQLVAEAYQNLGAPELDRLASWITGVLRTGKPPVELGGEVMPLYKKGDHLRPENWRPTCSPITEAKLVWMVVVGNIQRRLYAAGLVPDNMLGSVTGRSTQKARFLYDMYPDDEGLEVHCVRGRGGGVPQHASQRQRRGVEAVGAPIRRLRRRVSAHWKMDRCHGEGLYGVGDPR